ncbi:uncharacterized protein LOC144451669 [Glandiceps talaboti]
MAFLAQKLVFVTAILVLWCLIDAEGKRSGKCKGGQEGVLYKGSGINNAEGKTFTLVKSEKKCCKLCGKTEGCVAYVYEVESTKCHMKSTVKKEKTKEGYISGMMQYETDETHFSM